MSIRIADINDYNSVAILFHEILELHFKRRPDIFKDGEVINEKKYKEMIENPNDIILLYVEDKKIAGLCHLTKKENRGMSFVIDNVQAYIEDFIVNLEFRKRGIGTKLFDGAKRQAKEWNANSLELNVWEVNEEAISFYEKMGLKIKSRRMEYKI